MPDDAPRPGRPARQAAAPPRARFPQRVYAVASGVGILVLVVAAVAYLASAASRRKADEERRAEEARASAGQAAARAWAAGPAEAAVAGARPGPGRPAGGPAADPADATPDGPVVSVAVLPTAAGEGATWSHKELLDYLRARQINARMEMKSADGEPGAAADFVLTDGRTVRVRKAADGPAGRGPDASAFAWGRFRFTGDAKLVAAIRRVLGG